MKQTHNLMHDILLKGQRRETRSGVVYSVFRREIVHDMRISFPAPTTKKLMFNAMVGEGLWFANGDTCLGSLRVYSNLAEDAWTIWSNDCKRWHSKGDIQDAEGNIIPKDDLGKLYGDQWRDFGGSNSVEGVDQLQNLVDKMKNDPNSRYMIVQAYNPYDIADNAMALPPCHTGFQVYVDRETGEFDLDWTQRSVDVFLGLPFNIASYGWLMCVLGSITGLTPRFLYGSLKDTHIYESHLEAVGTQLSRIPSDKPCQLIMPSIKSLDDLKHLTAADFSLTDYDPMPAIKAPLSVG